MIKLSYIYSSSHPVMMTNEQLMQSVSQLNESVPCVFHHSWQLISHPFHGVAQALIRAGNRASSGPPVCLLSPESLSVCRLPLSC